ncbi:MAG: hypothetical protein AAGU74_13595 [Bacillota bacterium]
MKRSIENRLSAKEIARSILSKKTAGVRALNVPQNASPALGIKRLLSRRKESELDSLLREAAVQENAALVFPNSWEFLKQARARKSVRRARLVRSLGAVAACLVIAAAGVFYYRAQYAPKTEQAPMQMSAADSSAGMNGLGDIAPEAIMEQPMDSPLFAAAPSDASAPEMAIQDNALIPSAGNERSAGSSASGEIVSYEIRLIGEASPDAGAESLKDQGVTVEYGVSSPVALLPGEAAVCARDGSDLSLYYLYNGEDTLLLIKGGADKETLFSYALMLAQEG